MTLKYKSYTSEEMSQMQNQLSADTRGTNLRKANQNTIHTFSSLSPENSVTVCYISCHFLFFNVGFKSHDTDTNMCFVQQVKKQQISCLAVNLGLLSLNWSNISSKNNETDILFKVDICSKVFWHINAPIPIYIIFFFFVFFFLGS